MFKRKLKSRVKLILLGAIITSLSLFVFLFLHKKNTEKDNIVEVKEIAKEEIKTKLNEFQATKNKDIIGYFTFEQNDNLEAEILPVILTDGDYYMTHNLVGNKDGCGAIFIDDNEISEESNNVIVYGHSSTKKDCNFTFFKSYKEKTYFDTNEYFTYTDQNGEQKYQVLFMSLIDLENPDGVYLDWYNSYFYNTDEFINVLNETAKYSVTDKRIFTLNDKDKIFTLVTCDMSKKDARFVLFAKKV